MNHMIFICMFSLTNYFISKLDLYSILLIFPFLVKHCHVWCEKHCLFLAVEPRLLFLKRWNSLETGWRVSGLRKPRCEVLRLVGKEPYIYIFLNRLFCYLYLDYIDTGYKPLEWWVTELYIYKYKLEWLLAGMQMKKWGFSCRIHGIYICQQIFTFMGPETPIIIIIVFHWNHQQKMWFQPWMVMYGIQLKRQYAHIYIYNVHVSICTYPFCKPR